MPLVMSTVERIAQNCVSVRQLSICLPFHVDDCGPRQQLLEFSQRFADMLPFPSLTALEISTPTELPAVNTTILQLLCKKWSLNELTLVEEYEGGMEDWFEADRDIRATAAFMAVRKLSLKNFRHLDPLLLNMLLHALYDAGCMLEALDLHQYGVPMDKARAYRQWCKEGCVADAGAIEESKKKKMANDTSPACSAMSSPADSPITGPALPVLCVDLKPIWGSKACYRELYKSLSVLTDGKVRMCIVEHPEILDQHYEKLDPVRAQWIGQAPVHLVRRRLNVNTTEHEMKPNASAGWYDWVSSWWRL